MIFQDIKVVLTKLCYDIMKTVFSMYHIIFFIFSGNCLIRRCKCVNNTTVNKKLPCTDFCSSGLIYENVDSDPILETAIFQLMMMKKLMAINKKWTYI